MESSSNDSFFWADASNDSSDSEKNKIIVKSIKSKYKDEPGTSANYKQRECEKNLGTESENEPKKMQLKSKKRKCSETVQENCDYPRPEKKRIKLEPESDIDIEKKKKSRKDINTQDSIKHDEYFNLRVKQEETSLVQTMKKKKKKTSNSHIENASQSDSSIEPNRESCEKDLRIKQEQASVVEPKIVKSKKKKKHKRSNVSSDTEIASEAKLVTTVPDNLTIRVKQEETSLVETKKKKKKKTSNSHIENESQSNSSIESNRKSFKKDLQVKQEQASVVEPEIVKSKKKKKHKRSTVSSDIEIASEAKLTTTVSEVMVPNELSKLGEPTKYSIIEEKFFAEETVVETPRKNKRKKNAAESNNTDEDNKSTYLKENAEITLETDNDNLNNISLEPNDFTCNNIVSSTILNSSASEFRDTKRTQNEELVKKSKNIQPRKISDRIRFEEDDNSIQQDPQFDKTSDKINRFLKVNPQLKPFIWETSKDSLITKDDDIWTLTWPHEINLEKLNNTTVSSNDKICKLKIDGQTYDGVLNQDVTAVTLLTHEHTQAFIKNIPVEECIDYHKRIPKVHIPDNNIMLDNQRNFIPLPETKCRHPLFGAHYKKAIKISTAVVERLQAAKELHSETPSENIKKKKHKKQKHKSADIKTEDYPYIKPEREAFRKNKKRKCSQENDGPPKKLKRVNENADSPAVWESEKAIEENLFNF